MALPLCYFVSDLHGRTQRYVKLFAHLAEKPPAAVFLGGDLLPHGAVSLSGFGAAHSDFINDFLVEQFSRLRRQLGDDYPRVFIILGNDDGRFEEAAVLDVAARGLWEYIHDRHTDFGEYTIYGYAYVPPTPFLLKDWDRYDVSRFVDPGCISPEDGRRTVPVEVERERYATIADDLTRLTGNEDLEQAIFLFHTPPHQTKLDRAALDGQMVDHAPLDVHIGSIAVRRFIETRQPRLTLHGHVHESARITGAWQDRLGETICLSAAHDGPELALVCFDPDRPEEAERKLL